MIEIKSFLISIGNPNPNLTLTPSASLTWLGSYDYGPNALRPKGSLTSLRFTMSLRHVRCTYGARPLYSKVGQVVRPKPRIIILKLIVIIKEDLVRR